MSILNWFRKKCEEVSSPEHLRDVDPELREAFERTNDVARQLRVIELERAIQQGSHRGHGRFTNS